MHTWLVAFLDTWLFCSPAHVSTPCSLKLYITVSTYCLWTSLLCFQQFMKSLLCFFADFQSLSHECKVSIPTPRFFCPWASIPPWLRAVLLGWLQAPLSPVGGWFFLPSTDCLGWPSTHQACVLKQFPALQKLSIWDEQGGGKGILGNEYPRGDECFVAVFVFVALHQQQNRPPGHPRCLICTAGLLGRDAFQCKHWQQCVIISQASHSK